VQLTYPDYEFLLAFVAHRYGLPGTVLPPGSPHAGAAPCWAMPRDPAFDGPQWRPESLCGELRVDVALLPPGEALFQFAAQPGYGVGALAFVARPSTGGDALLAVERGTGVVRTLGNLAEYCGCSDGGWLRLRVALEDSRGVGAAQEGALSIQLLGCEPQLECQLTQTPTPSRSRASTSTRTRTRTRTAAGTATRTATRTGAGTATRSRSGGRALRA
jgi:hypothetical protein